MKRHLAITAVFFMMGAMIAAETPPAIPEHFVAVLPTNGSQVLLTLATSQEATSAKMWLLEKTGTSGWKAVQEPISVMIGRNGMAWGLGEHPSRLPRGWKRKMEGDLCTPAGVFAVTAVFGNGARPHRVRMPYMRCTQHHVGVDDPASRFYNQIVDLRDRPVIDWKSHESMVTQNGCYDHGVVVAHNPTNKPGAGSCIFMHIWRGEKVPTSGCTAMSERDMMRVISWLDPAKAPRLVQTVLR